MPKTGGGIQSRVVKRVGIHGGSRTTTAVSPRGISQLGASQGGKLRREGSFTSTSSALPFFEGPRQAAEPMGNAVAASTKAGPGGSRTVYKTGTQQLHGSVAGPAPVQGREILGQYGPETTNRSSLVRK